MSRFVTSVADIVKKECRTTMLHNDINISRLMVYSQFIEESKLKRLGRDLKRGRYDEKNQPRFKKRDPNHNVYNAPKVNHEEGGGSHVFKTT